MKKGTAKSKQRRTMTGTVVSAQMANTVVVAVARFRQNPIYKKVIRRTRKFPANTGNFALVVGDRVRIAATRPASKTKHFEVVKKL